MPYTYNLIPSLVRNFCPFLNFHLLFLFLLYFTQHFLILKIFLFMYIITMMLSIKQFFSGINYPLVEYKLLVYSESGWNPKCSIDHGSLILSRLIPALSQQPSVLPVQFIRSVQVALPSAALWPPGYLLFLLPLGFFPNHTN